MRLFMITLISTSLHFSTVSAKISTHTVSLSAIDTVNRTLFLKRVDNVVKQFGNITTILYIV